MSTSFSSTQPLLSIRDVCRLLSVGRQSVSRWAKAGELRSFKLGGSVRFRPADIAQFIADSERKSQSKR